MLHTDQPTPCDTDTERWFSTDKSDIDYAKAQCRGCPRKLDCLEETLSTELALGMQLKGVHALSAEDRMKLSVKRIA